MTIDRIKYGKTYNLGSYSSERVDLECTLDTDDDMEEAFKILKEHCDSIHKKNNPQLYQEQERHIVSQWATQPHQETTLTCLPPQPEKISPEQETEALILAISEATIEELPQYQLLAAKNQKTMGAFNRRKKQLNI